MPKDKPLSEALDLQGLDSGRLEALLKGETIMEDVSIPAKTKQKWYVGINDGKYEAFRTPTEPTRKTHSFLYAAVIGPFRTKRAAMWAEKNGNMNPHFYGVNDAERLSR